MGICHTVATRHPAMTDVATISDRCNFVPFYKASYSLVTSFLGNFHPTVMELRTNSPWVPDHLNHDGDDGLIGTFGCSEAVYQGILFKHPKVYGLFAMERYGGLEGAAQSGMVGEASGTHVFHLKRVILQFIKGWTDGGEHGKQQMDAALAGLEEWTSPCPKQIVSETLQELAAGDDPSWTELWGHADNHTKLQRMRVALYAKYAPGQRDTEGRELLGLLHQTGSVMLVEHCPKFRDVYWADGTDGEGRNWLGKLLMEVRSGADPAAFDPESRAIEQADIEECTQYHTWIEKVSVLHAFSNGESNDEIDRQHVFPDPIIEDLVVCKNWGERFGTA
eukprot:TRINITY_DN4349_c0_g2_i2.p1 TRINITY_DN4349_c0_g2~~TRINITY_DN4349_c0_g2_i2.p1  ORF type:complete len:335 (-),score=75.09 TRINITY_DN4349_c0_g2_i2:244-1248(-)